MPEETVAAASSAVQESPVSYEIPRSGTPEYTEWRTTGNLPEKTKPQADSAPADAPEQVAKSEGDEPESAGEPEAPLTQEKRKGSGAEQRIKELVAERNRLKAELESHRAKPTQAESSPAKPEPPQQPQTYTDWRKAFDADAWESKYIDAHPEVKYAEVHAAMADYLADVRDHFRTREQAAQTQAKEFAAKVSEARNRHAEFDSTVTPFVSAFLADQKISPRVKDMVEDSDVFADLAFTLAGDPKFMAMAQNEPGKAVRYIAKVEAQISEEIGGSSESAPRNDKGQFTKAETAPAKRGPESAPEPPISIGSRGAGPMDESERAFKAIKSGDLKATRSWLEAENKKLNSARRGF